ncbi:DUF6770 family protein [Flaviaesturariibacter amylovorans]|uniref:Uncharacterized protein n=1 Tax=Flaviaesturariibacter amylovorans TaxID=1084520 RepID=A0ABP8GH48_9BACT
MFRRALLPLLLLLPALLRAQARHEISDVTGFLLRNSGAFLRHDSVRGYYFLYETEKQHQDTQRYALALLDAALKPLRTLHFDGTKALHLVETADNGQELMFLFFDPKAKQLQYRVLRPDTDSVSLFTRVLERNTVETLRTAFKAPGGSAPSENTYLVPVPGRGFLSTIPTGGPFSASYEVQFFDVAADRTWSYVPAAVTDLTHGAQYLGQTDSLALFETHTRNSALFAKTESFLMALSLRTGQPAYETRLADSSYQTYPMYAGRKAGSNNLLVIGPHFLGRNKYTASRSMGIALWELDETGKALRTVYNFYAEDFSRYIDVSNGHIDRLGFLYYHDIRQLPDGRIVVSGEGYYKSPNPGGILASALTLGAATALSTGGPVAGKLTQMVVSDMALLQFDDQFRLTGFRIFEKKNNIARFASSLFSSPHNDARRIRALGYFDYCFSLGSGRTSFRTGYLGHEKSRSHKIPSFQSLHYRDGLVIHEKALLPSRADRQRVYPANGDQVLVAEVFRKERRLALRLEPLQPVLEQ